MEFSKAIRILTLKLVYKAKASHIGGALSMADILSVLYGSILRYDPNNPGWELRDRFLLSKGHAVSSLYATLALKGFFSVEDLLTYGDDGSIFLSHASHKVKGIELSTGSLGHALSVGCGIALAAKKKNYSWKTYVLLSDGELNEGSNWEAILFAQHHKLNNLVAIIDYNKIQSFGRNEEVINLGSLKNKFESFDWNSYEVDGHNNLQLFEAFKYLSKNCDKPSVIIANTIKGKGVDFMEDKLLWHYKSPSKEQFEEAIRQIQGEK
jgi:transketolase